MSTVLAESPRRWVRPVGWLWVVTTCALTALVAVNLRNDHADCYEYLRISKQLWERGADVPRGRPALLPLLQLPLWSTGSARRAWVGAHLLQTGIAVGAVILAMLAMRGWIGRAALPAVVLLCLDRVFIHFAPFALTDHLALLSLATMNVLWRATVERRGAVAATVVGAVTGVLCHAKYILIVVPISLTVAGNARGGWRSRLTYCLGVGAGLLCTRGLVDHVAGRPVTRAFGAVVESFVLGAKGAHLGEFGLQAAVAPLRFLMFTASPGLVLAAAVGCAVSRRCRGPRVLELALFMIGLCVVVGEKEARYLLPALVVFYSLSAAGLSAMWSAVARARGSAVASGLVGLLLVPPLLGALGEWREHLAGGVSRVPAEEVAAKIAARATPTAQIFWRGGAFPLYDSHRVRMLGDDYYATVRLGPAGLAYWLGRRVLNEAGGVPLLQGPLDARRAHAFVRRHGDGDLILVAPERDARAGVLRSVGVAIEDVTGLEGHTADPWRGLLARCGTASGADGSVGFTVAFCGGHLRALPLVPRGTMPCEEPAARGPAWLVCLTSDVLATTEVAR